MRVISDLSSNEVLQGEPTPEEGTQSKMNGRYAVEIPVGSVEVNAASYTVPVDGGDMSSLGFSQLLARYPTYENIVFNPLLTTNDVGDLDLAAVIDNTSNQILASPYTGEYTPRLQTGRFSGVNVGLAPNSTAMLAVNDHTTPPKPGLIVSDTIDISGVTGGLGADSFMVYWRIYQFETSEDIRSSYGGTSGTNEPAIRYLEETDQEPSLMTVAISNNDGGSWTVVRRFEPVSFCEKGTLVRVAFFNTYPFKLYLANYAILF
ncbi:MAG: hypothetical protein GF334_08790 [Candidatus Altiarchaeales archaeon]|nr:hypothetical protein [Candidatus Altiarchaeales archaeon]